MPTRSHASRLLRVAALCACVAVGLAAVAPPWAGATRVLVGTTGLGAGAELPASLTGPRHLVVERDATLAGLRARRYAPDTTQRGSPALLFPGAHPLGIDEPRLQRMARALAGEGLTVHAVELPDLRALRLGPDTVAEIATAVAAASERAGGARVTAFGISVTGGLLLQAALEPRAERALAAVVAVGAHHDLRAVARAYAAGAASSRAHVVDPYGARVLTSAYADALVPQSDVELARQAIHLHVSERYADARAVLVRLSPPGRAVVAPLLEEPREAIPGLMAALLERRGTSLAALSPSGKLGSLRVPAFLLHGEHDPVVPSSETRALAAELADAPEVRVLITPLLRHAEGSSSPAFGDAFALVDFMAAVLATAERRADP